MGNSEIIDSVVDPIAIKQFNDLKIASAEATEQMVIATKAAIALNNATGGSQSFAVFKKNAEASSVALNTVIINTEKKQQAEEKARVYKSQMDEKALNKYLVLMSKQQAAQEAQDAKELSAAQKKADKLAAIQAEADAKALAAAEKRRRILEIENKSQRPVDPKNPYNLTNPTFTIEDAPISTPEEQAYFDQRGTENKRPDPSISAGRDAQLRASQQSKVAIVAESGALTEQQVILNKVNGSFSDNISEQLALQAQLASVRAEMKKANTETESGVASRERLKSEEVRLKTAIQQNSSILNQQSKELLSADGSGKQLNARLAQLRLAYDSLTIEQQKNIKTGGVLLTEIKLLDAETKKLSADQGIHTKEVGNYAGGFSKVSSAVGSAFGALRKLAYVLPGIGIAGIFALAFDEIGKVIDKLDLFNRALSETELRSKGFTDALGGGDYSKAFEQLTQLKVNLDLAKDGFIDKDRVIDEYNNTIGKVTGAVDSLDEAEKGLVKNGENFIRITLLKAAANIILADAAKDAAETAISNQKLQDKIAQSNKDIQFVKTEAPKDKAAFGGDPRGLIISLEKQGQSLTKEINDNNKKLDDSYKKRLAIITNFDKEQANLNKGFGQTAGDGGTGDGVSAVATLRNAIANQELEKQKIIAQNIMGDEKKSYGDRLKATQDFYNASKQIALNNETLALSDKLLSGNQKLKIEQDFNNTVLQLSLTRDNQLQSLNDKQYKQQQENIKKDLTAQKDLAKEIVDNQTQSLNARLAALDIYREKSAAILKINEKEALRDAGQNGESIKAAKKDFTNASLALDKEYNAGRLKIFKEVDDQLKKNLEDLFKAQKDSEIKALELLDDANKAALKKLDDQKNERAGKVADDYEKRKISLKKYNREILAIEDQYNIDRLNQEILHDQAVIRIKEAKTNADVSFAAGNGASDNQLNDIKAQGTKDVQGDKDKLANDIKALNDAKNKQKQDNAKTPKDTNEDIAKSIGYLQELQDAASKAIQANTQAEIDLLEKKKQLIDDQAQAEITAVNGSIQSESDKQRKINVINGQAAQSKARIDEQEKRAKQKQAAYDRALAIASIIENTAIGITRATGTVFGLSLVPIIAALGAAELALVLATPLPKYEKGGTTKGGAFIWGEKGKELAIEPSGKSYFSPDHASLGVAPAGTQIIPNHMIRPDKLNYTGGQQAPWGEVLRELRKNRPVETKRPVNKINVNLDSYYQKFYR